MFDQPNAAPRRLNKGCHLVLNALGGIEKLASAQEIYMWLRENFPEEAPALTTVYRSIDSLMKFNQIQAVDIGDGEKRYERVEPGKHHHHLICTNCKNSIHLDNCFIETLTGKVEQHHGFKVRAHVLEIFGICQKCKGN